MQVKEYVCIFDNEGESFTQLAPIDMSANESSQIAHYNSCWVSFVQLVAELWQNNHGC